MFHNFVFRCKITAFVAHKCSVFLHICTSVWWISPHEASLSQHRTIYSYFILLLSLLFHLLLLYFPPLVMLSRLSPRVHYTNKITLKAIFICIYEKNVVILWPNLRWRGMSCGKCFAIGSSLGRFLTYWIAFIDALRLINRKLRNFSFTLQIKVISRCLWVWLYPCCTCVWCSMFSYQRRFPVVLFDLVGNAKASVNK